MPRHTSAWGRRLRGLVGCLLAALAPAEAADRLLIRDATLLTVTDGEIAGGDLLIEDGKIVRIGKNVQRPAGTPVLDGTGLWVMPGVVDAHSHMGVYSWPGTRANADGNEATAPVTAQVRAADSVNVEDPAFARARAGGVTTIQILPGSANVIGGEGVILKLRPIPSLEGMRFAGAPRVIKMAFGENPKRVYGNRGQMPSTRMGTTSVMRQAFIEAREYLQEWERHAEREQRHREKLARWEADADRDPDERPEPPTPPKRDLKLETLADVLRGKVRVNIHCYRADGIRSLLKISDEFGFQITALHHALEAYKVADELAARDIGVATFTDWWGYKVEAWDAVPWQIAHLVRAGVRACAKSDSGDVVQRMNQEAAKSIKYGGLSRDQALATVTLTPAWILGVDDRVGSLEVGKDADLSIWDADPLSVYARCRMTLIDGAVVYDRSQDTEVTR